VGQRRGAVAVIVHQGRWLVIRRSGQVVAPGAYCFPGGGIEPGESEPAALIRELREELGVAIRPIRRLWESTTPWGVTLGWWQSELDANAPIRPNPAEVESYAWCTLEELVNLPELLPTNRRFLEALAAGQIQLGSAI